MRVWTYYMKPGGAPLEDAVATPEGFSWGAMAFGAVWALWRRLWFFAACLALAPPAIAGLTMAFPAAAPAGAALALLIALFAGCVGNDLRRGRLEREGYVLAGVAVGRSLAEADRRFFGRATARP